MTNNNHEKGFASMSQEDRRRIASSGGKTAHAMCKAHRYTKKEAAAAGRKGGLAKKRNARGIPEQELRDMLHVEEPK